jgi:hypothetical protein
MPSVTTVLSILDKPQLQRWRDRQITDTCYANPSIQKGKYKWTPDAYYAEMTEQAFQVVGDAASLGTEIHASLEAHFGGEPFDFSKEVELPSGENVPLINYCNWVTEWVADNEVTINDCEVRLVNKEYGYAGLTDAVITKGDTKGILDFKTRKSKEGEKMKPWDNEPTQIAAYHIAKYGSIDESSIGVNVFISTTEPGRIEATWYDAETLKTHWEKFTLCLSLWKILKKYDPTKEKQ